MTNQKNLGSYYTPEFLSEFMIEHVASHFKGETELSILEPSVGNGSFLKAFSKIAFPTSIKDFSLTAIEKISAELQKAKKESKITPKRMTKYTFLNIDFLTYQSTKRFSLVVGNPPYIKKSLLTSDQIKLCAQIYQVAELKNGTTTNIWTAFLLKSALLLTDNGVLALVLPAELLQVKFSEDLRQFLKSYFERIEIFTFDDLLFQCKGQDTIILIAFKKSIYKGQYFTHIKDTAELLNKQFVLSKNDGIAITNSKWSHHLLSSDNLEFIHRLGAGLLKVNDYCETKPGIVTAANKFFIIDQQTEAKYNLKNYTLPIIQNGFCVNGGVSFKKEDYNGLIDAGYPCRLLSFKDVDRSQFSRSVLKYLEIGESQKLQENYKCSKRKNWYVIPNISETPDGFFFRRSHLYPKLIKNECDVFVTDSAYKIAMKNAFAINDLIFSFYNSLSLSFIELFGRYYGGGVLELTPTEFKAIPIPMISIKRQTFNSFKTKFENKNSISEILRENDQSILEPLLGLGTDDIKKIQVIYDFLVAKRLRN